MFRKSALLITLTIIIVTGMARSVTFTTNILISDTNTSFDGQDIIVDNCTMTVNGTHSFNSLQVLHGGIITHTQLYTQILTIATNVNIDPLSKIDANGKGYGTDDGPGRGGDGISYGAGAGYGGLGGNSYKNNSIGGSTYGSITEPIHFGSGGGSGSGSSGGAGGGAIRLTVEGTLTLNGQINSNGTAGPYWQGGGGAGGSVYLTVGIIEGSGAINANGGRDWGAGDYGGGGGGGRIAVYYDTYEFIGNILASGKIGSSSGGAGTVYLKSSSETYGHLRIDNDNLDGNTTPLTATDNFFDIFCANHGKLDISTPGIITVIDQLTVANGGYAYIQTTQTLPKIHILDGGELSHRELQNDFNVVVTGDVIVEAGGKISADGKGYSGSSGPGKGTDSDSGGGGGGYGGAGGTSYGAAGGSPYGSITEPNLMGSGGGSSINGFYPGGAGGGIIRMMINGTLTNNGQISSNGNASGNNTGGAGSGGSVYLNVGTLSGAGTIIANGGTNPAGGGGGGRIAVYYATNNYVGTIYANGGVGHSSGQNGTIQSNGCGDPTHPYPIGDLNYDCKVNFEDFTYLAQHWLENTAP